MSMTSNQSVELEYVSLSDVSKMREVVDCEVMNGYIFAVCDKGEYWYCKQALKRPMSINEVPFYPAEPWMVKRWKQLIGKGKIHENDQFEDKRIMKENIEKREYDSWTDMDYFGSKDKMINEIMPGAFGGEYANVEFTL